MSGWGRPVRWLGLALLYGGVLVTGMTLPPLAALPLSAAALLSYNLLMRPVRDWAPNAPAFGFSLLVLAAVAAALCAAGYYLGAWVTPPSPVIGPGLCLVGLALSRLGWSASKASEMDALLDDALTQIEGIAKDLERHSAAHVQLAQSYECSDPALRADLDHLRAALATLPPDEPRRGEVLDALLAPFAKHWSDAIPALSASGTPADLDAAARLLLSPEILPQAFGHPGAAHVLTRIFHGTPATAEAAAQRAMAMDLTEAECWRLLPSADALTEQARLFDDPPALTALAAYIAEREAEDDLRRD